jgi:hypothetical protein
VRQSRPRRPIIDSGGEAIALRLYSTVTAIAAEVPLEQNLPPSELDTLQAIHFR